MNKISEKQNIPFNYFLIMFNKEVQKRTIEKFKSSISDDSEDYEDYEDYDYMHMASIYLKEEENLEIYNASFYEILISYLTLSNNEEITMRPTKPLDLCSLILNNMENTPYNYSLLCSLQFIIAKYLELLGKGNPVLMSGENPEKEKSFKVIYDSKHRINTFDSTNMTLEEQSDVMLKVLRNVTENKEEKIPYVNYVTRTDI